MKILKNFDCKKLYLSTFDKRKNSQKCRHLLKLIWKIKKIFYSNPTNDSKTEVPRGQFYKRSIKGQAGYVLRTFACKN